MDKLNSNGADFVRGINFSLKESETSDETIKTSRAVSSLAVAYEAARNAVEFKSEHLIRQAAIVRILRRRLFLGESSERVAPLLIRELIWARYLKDNSVPVAKIDKIEDIINKYRVAFTLTKEKELSEWLLNLAGCEIERNLAPNPYPQLIINFVAGSLQPKIKIASVDDEKIKDIQVYIAVERAFAKNSNIFITFHLLEAVFPRWFAEGSKDSKGSFPELLSAKTEIDRYLQFSLGVEVKREVARMVAPFNVIREMVIRDPQGFLKSVEDKSEFEKVAHELLAKLYAENKGKSVRASTRSIIYIFLTKMVFAIALELPFDVFLGRTDYLALGINLVFPPALMFLLNARIVTPDEENTKKIIEKIEEYVYSDKPPAVTVVGKRKAAASIFEQIFLMIYSILFIGIFVFIIWGLNKLNFNVISQGIFIFFLCVVSFFAYRVRSISRDYVYEEPKGGFFSSLVDFLFLPIVRVGQWLSGQIARLDLLGFVFDFIIEAPLKAFLEVIEEWVHFVRAKKEEIFTEG
jgi:hypothetical protein